MLPHLANLLSLPPERLHRPLETTRAVPRLRRSFSPDHRIASSSWKRSTSCQPPKSVLGPCCAFPHTRSTAVYAACRSVRQRCDSIGCESETSTSLCLHCLIVAEASQPRSVAVLSAVSMNVSTFADHPASRMLMLSRAKESRLRVEEYFPL